MRILPVLVLSLCIGSSEAVAQQTIRVSLGSSGTQGDASADADSSISATGRFVAFGSQASNLVAGDTNDEIDVFVRDRDLNGNGIFDEPGLVATVRVSVSSAGGQSNSPSLGASISADGRFVAFWSSGGEFVPNDTNGHADVFVHDRDADSNGIFDEPGGISTIRVSVSSTGMQGEDFSLGSSISADGRFIAFDSVASNLVPEDTSGIRDVFVHDRVNGTTIRMSVDSVNVEANAASQSPVISTTGRFVAFVSAASNLVPGNGNMREDAFVRDRDADGDGIFDEPGAVSTVRVSVDSSDVEGNGDSFFATVSSNGRFVAFQSTSTNLVADDTNGVEDVFLRDRDTDGDGIYDTAGAVSTTRLSVSSAGGQGNDASSRGVISADGHFIAFQSLASNLVPADSNGSLDAFVYDRITRVTTQLSVSSAGVSGNAESRLPSLSLTGHDVSFFSQASNLVAGDTNSQADVFVRDFRDPSVCRAGTVNLTSGPIADVLTVNGSAGDANRTVAVALSSPIDVTLGASPSGPSPARYVLWVWPLLPSNAFDLMGRGQLLGCTVNPSPFRPSARPQPFRCLSGGMPAAVCTGVTTIHPSARAPWTLHRPTGIARPFDFTLQGVIQDLGAGNSTGYSVTNAVILQVR